MPVDTPLPISVLIVDDEMLARRLVREFLAPHADMHIVGECENGQQAVQAIQAQQPQLVFLDIQMPKLSGLEVLEVTGRDHGVIFTTAYDQYALKAFDHHAVDYLLKPFSQARFDEALQQARKGLAQPLPRLQQLVAAGATEKLERILVRDRGQVHIVPVDSVDYVEAQDDYIAIHFDGRMLLKTQRLSDLEAQLDARRFVRVHRSFLINLERLKSIERPSKDSQVAVLASGVQIPISRAGHDRLKTLMAGPG
jgi:two-component system LytT family response regulator